MDHLQMYPVLLADPVVEYNKNKNSFYIFSSSQNRGYKLDGHAADLCHRFNGKKTLAEIIAEFEKDANLESDFFKAEISSLIQDLQKNSLIEFFNTPQFRDA